MSRGKPVAAGPTARLRGRHVGPLTATALTFGVVPLNTYVHFCEAHLPPALVDLSGWNHLAA